MPYICKTFLNYENVIKTEISFLQFAWKPHSISRSQTIRLFQQTYAQ